MADQMNKSVAILDFGSQYAQLIARRIRELQVYCELFPWDTASEKVLAINPVGFILSGGPESVYVPGAPQVPDYVLDSQFPVLGICYGMQALTHALGGRVAASTAREYGQTQVKAVVENNLIPAGEQQVWMSHGDRIEIVPDGFTILATSENSPIAAMGDIKRHYYGLQFHPEVNHTPGGRDILRRYVEDICAVKPEWTPELIITSSVEKIKQQVGSSMAISATSGGVDSSVATALAQRALGDQLVSIFVDTGMLRKGEVAQVQSALHQKLGVELVVVDAVEPFMNALQGVTEPEKKRVIIGELFIRIFEREAKKLGTPDFLIQGTIYPDVVESSAPDRSKAHRIKTHHNVGGIPGDIAFKLVEPLRYLFKDEVREVGLALGLPKELIWRQPFPGPGLAVRCLGEVSLERLDKLREADDIFTSELAAAGLLHVDRSK